MPARFRPGAFAYTKDGRRYTVEEVEDGMVYCVSDAGAETEFVEANLFNEAEWLAKSGNRTDKLYAAIRQSKAYQPRKLNRGASEKLLAKAERLMPGILDYTAFVSAERVLAELGQAAAASELSIVKCREIFDAALPEARAGLLASLIGNAPEVVLGAVDLGDNLMRAMLGKAEEAGGISLDSFRSRPRR
ncbi:MAG TPA: hypothetical protein VL574_02065 [Stellaceae bacterium]|jgi:hypothetical protein|nr:hypothetical protein [Stellaceae bacterium]